MAPPVTLARHPAVPAPATVPAAAAAAAPRAAVAATARAGPGALIRWLPLAGRAAARCCLRPVLAGRAVPTGGGGASAEAGGDPVLGAHAPAASACPATRARNTRSGAAGTGAAGTGGALRAGPRTPWRLPVRGAAARSGLAQPACPGESAPRPGGPAAASPRPTVRAACRPAGDEVSPAPAGAASLTATPIGAARIAAPPVAAPVGRPGVTATRVTAARVTAARAGATAAAVRAAAALIHCHWSQHRLSQRRCHGHWRARTGHQEGLRGNCRSGLASVDPGADRGNLGYSRVLAGGVRQSWRSGEGTAGLNPTRQYLAPRRVLPIHNTCVVCLTY